MKRTALLISILLLTTAASDTTLNGPKYQLPADAASTAIMKFLKGNLYLSIFGGDAQYYGFLKGETCQSAQKLIAYSAGLLGNLKESPVKIEAGHPVRILATIIKDNTKVYGPIIRQRDDSCTRIVQFTPEAGKTYHMTQDAKPESATFCGVTVTETTTGAPPADIAAVTPLPCHY
jgi:hypothetical protein